MHNIPSEQSRADVGGSRPDLIEKRSGRQSHLKALPGIRFACLGVFLILILFAFVFRIGDQPVVPIVTRHVAPPIQPPISIPEPVAQAIPEPVVQAIPEPAGSSNPECVAQLPLNATLKTNMASALPEPQPRELASPLQQTVSEAPNDSLLADDVLFVRYLERHTGADHVVPSLLKHLESEGGVLNFGRFQVGYGRIFAGDSLITRGFHRPVWEETSCLYLKTSFRF
jgi:hypothetical protein